MNTINAFVGRLRKSIFEFEQLLIWIMSALLAYEFIRQGSRKFDLNGWWAPAFEKWGYPGWFMLLVGGFEVGGGVAILIPKFRHFGAIALTVIMLGAVCTKAIHKLSFDEVLYFASTISFLVFLIGYRFSSAQNQNHA